MLTGGGGVGRRRQGRDVEQCEVGRRGVGMRGVESRGVSRAARGRTGGVGGAGECVGLVSWAHGIRLVGWKDVLKKDVVKQWESCKSEQLTVSEAIEVETILDHFHQYGFVVPCKKRYYKRKVLSISIMQ
jgi:hypothetical protein